MEKEEKKEVKKEKKKATKKVAEKKEIVKKEVKEERQEPSEKVIHFEEDKQKKLKLASKFLYIMTKISQVLVVIGIVGMFIAMICVPIFTSNIKVKNKGSDMNTIELFDTKVNYTREKEKVTFYEVEDIENKVEIKNKKDVEAVNKVFDYLEKNDLSKLTIFVEIIFVLATVSLFILYIILKNAYLLFKNINKEYSPFILENIEILKKITKLLIYSLVVSLIIELVVTIVIGTDYSLNLSFTNIIEIVIVYGLSLIFEYGNKLQNATKGKIYTDID